MNPLDLPLASLLPHRDPAIVLDHLLSMDEEGCTAAARVRADSPFLTAAGDLPAWVGRCRMYHAADTLAAGAAADSQRSAPIMNHFAPVVKGFCAILGAGSRLAWCLFPEMILLLVDRQS